MTTNLYNIIRYTPTTPGTNKVAEVYGRREAAALRDSYQAKDAVNTYKVVRAS